MKVNKRMMAISASVMMLAATSVTAFASSAYNTPAEVVADLTGRTLETVIAERTESSNTYGTIANEAGVLDSFKVEMLEVKKDTLAEKVANGTMTQERANEILAALEEAQVNCDGTGSAEIGKQYGAGFGNQNNGTGKGSGNGIGRGAGMGGQGRMGMGLNDSSCLAE
jgi:hypothetical protein